MFAPAFNKCSSRMFKDDVFVEHLKGIMSSTEVTKYGITLQDAMKLSPSFPWDPMEVDRVVGWFQQQSAQVLDAVMYVQENSSCEHCNGQEDEGLVLTESPICNHHCCTVCLQKTRRAGEDFFCPVDGCPCLVSEPHLWAALDEPEKRKRAEHICGAIRDALKCSLPSCNDCGDLVPHGGLCSCLKPFCHLCSAHHPLLYNCSTEKLIQEQWKEVQEGFRFQAALAVIKANESECENEESKQLPVTDPTPQDKKRLEGWWEKHSGWRDPITTVCAPVLPHLERKLVEYDKKIAQLPESQHQECPQLFIQQAIVCEREDILKKQDIQFDSAAYKKGRKEYGRITENLFLERTTAQGRKRSWDDMNNTTGDWKITRQEERVLSLSYPTLADIWFHCEDMARQDSMSDDYVQVLLYLLPRIMWFLTYPNIQKKQGTEAKVRLGQLQVQTEPIHAAVWDAKKLMGSSCLRKTMCSILSLECLEVPTMRECKLAQGHGLSGSEVAASVLRNYAVESDVVQHHQQQLFLSQQEPKEREQLELAIALSLSCYDSTLEGFNDHQPVVVAPTAPPAPGGPYPEWLDRPDG